MRNEAFLVVYCLSKFLFTFGFGKRDFVGEESLNMMAIPIIPKISEDNKIATVYPPSSLLLMPKFEMSKPALNP